MVKANHIPSLCPPVFTTTLIASQFIYLYIYALSSLWNLLIPEMLRGEPSLEFTFSLFSFCFSFRNSQLFPSSWAPLKIRQQSFPKLLNFLEVDFSIFSNGIFFFLKVLKPVWHFVLISSFLVTAWIAVI